MLPELACHVGFMNAFSVLFYSTMNLYGPCSIVDFTVLSFMFPDRSSTRPIMVKKTPKKNHTFLEKMSNFLHFLRIFM